MNIRVFFVFAAELMTIPLLTLNKSVLSKGIIVELSMLKHSGKQEYLLIIIINEYFCLLTEFHS